MKKTKRKRRNPILPRGGLLPAVDADFMVDTVLEIFILEAARKLGYKKAYLSLIAADMIWEKLPVTNAELEAAFAKRMADEEKELGYETWLAQG